MTVNSVAVVIAKFLFGMCDCTVHSDVGTVDFSLVLGTLHMCRHVHMGSFVFQAWTAQSSIFRKWKMLIRKALY